MTGRIVATFDNYLGLVAAVRARLLELGISFETLDELAGWTSTYATKLLGEEPIKHFGPMSFDAVIGSIGVKVAFIEDDEALERLRKHRNFVPRKRAPNRLPIDGKQEYVVRRVTRENMRQISVLAAEARRLKISPARRKKIAQKAARARHKLGRN